MVMLTVHVSYLVISGGCRAAWAAPNGEYRICFCEVGR